MSLTLMSLSVLFAFVVMDDEKAVNDQLKAIGESLKKLRSDGDFEGGYVGFAIHHVKIAPRQYWRIETGETNVTIGTLMKVLKVHNMSLKEFFEGL